MRYLKNYQYIVILSFLIASFFINPSSVSSAENNLWTHHVSATEINDYTAGYGSVWVGTTGGVAEYDIETGAKTLHLLTEWGDDTNIYDIQTGPDGNVWAVAQHSVSRYDGTSWSVYEGPEHLHLKEVQFDSQGRLWGTDTVDVYCYDTEGRHHRIVPKDFYEEGLINLTIDSEDVAWIHLQGILMKIGPGPNLDLYRIDDSSITHYFFENGYYRVSDIVRRSDGSNLVSILFYPSFYKEENSPAYYIIYEITGSTYESIAVTTPMLQIWSYSNAFFGADGSIWKYEDNLVAQFVDGDWVQVPSEYVSGALFERVTASPDSAMWCISDRGLARFKNSEWSLFPTVGGEQAVATELLGFTSDSSPWFRTDQGAAIFDGTSWKTYATADSIQNPVVTETGLVYRKDLFTVAVCANDTISYYTDNTQPDSNTIHDIDSCTDGILRIVTPNGIAARENGIWGKPENVLDQDRDISRLMFDNTGTLWLTGRNDQEYVDTDYHLLFSVTGQNEPVNYDITFGDYPNSSTYKTWYKDITALESSPDGAIWVGTDEGVVRIVNGTPTRFAKTSHITDIECASDGTVWIGTDGNGLYQYKNDTWTRYTTDDILSDHVTALESHPELGVIVGTDNGLSRFTDGIWLNYHPALHQSTGTSPLPDEHIKDIFVDSSNRLWIATSSLSIADGTGWKPVLTADDGLHSEITGIVELPDGTLWCATESSGLFSCVVNEIDQVVEPDAEIIWPIEFITSHYIVSYYVLTIDNQDQYFLINSDNCFFYNGSQWLWLEFQTTRIMDIDCDDNIVWVSTAAGIFRYSDGAFQTFTVADGLLENAVRHTVITGNGDIWCAHYFENIGVSRYRDGQWQGFTHEDGVPDGPLIYNEGSLKGLYLLPGDIPLVRSSDDDWAQFNGVSWIPYTLPIDIPSEQIADIQADQNGGMWISTQGAGLYHISADNNQVLHYNTDSGLPSDILSDIRVVDDESIWVSTPEGLVYITEASIMYYPIPVRAFDLDSSNRLIAYTGEWIIHLDPSLGGVPVIALNSVDVEDDYEQDVPSAYHINNYPNPFNPQTTITFSMPTTSHVAINIYTINGQKICGLLNSQVDSGTHHITWNGTDDSGNPVSSGVYFAHLASGGHTVARKMLLIR